MELQLIPYFASFFWNFATGSISLEAIFKEAAYGFDIYESPCIFVDNLHRMHRRKICKHERQEFIFHYWRKILEKTTSHYFILLIAYSVWVLGEIMVSLLTTAYWWHPEGKKRMHQSKSKILKIWNIYWICSLTCTQ